MDDGRGSSSHSDEFEDGGAGAGAGLGVGVAAAETTPKLAPPPKASVARLNARMAERRAKRKTRMVGGGGGGGVGASSRHEGNDDGDGDGGDDDELTEEERRRLKRTSVAYDAFVRRSGQALSSSEVRERLVAVESALDRAEADAGGSDGDDDVAAVLDDIERQWSEDSAEAVPDVSPGRAKPLAAALGVTGCALTLVAIVFGFMAKTMDLTEAAVLFGFGTAMLLVSVIFLVGYIFCADPRRDDYAGLDNPNESEWTFS
ncbi:uncharacterized protein AMSG_07441 [Thecamonas trahens ATCC 50062]|uniref:Uncharacterized protein n=1 Tax=Thecamonas trahens ATCC 50062 TaxID=461836 RepID=A0A0L0DGT9_THETB|nr:hypothetical protein AMSG_07441 [Thecamonas trahens ATCC 50062]KNC51542.1 hypothetical protein AMSG_07441 [Thecamonas trahens ATCC 50062]|eukprot:XP_013755944.1 hypothetical protein AMSG_07441 [Thecamonas trahens ATCC 50062]